MASWITVYAVVIAVTAWGSYHFATRDPRATSWMKIGFAVFFLLGFGAIALFQRYVPFDESPVAFALLAIHTLGIDFGVPICLGIVMGAAAGMHRKASIDDGF